MVRQLRSLSPTLEAMVVGDGLVCVCVGGVLFLLVLLSGNVYCTAVMLRMCGNLPPVITSKR